jgi:dihydrofolate reductase
MAKLLYITNTSLDGYIEDAQGDFQFTEPSDDGFAFITDLIRPTGRWLYGRRLYEMMAVWETDPALAAASELRRDFAEAWQTAPKVVYSTTLAEPITANTRIERHFDPAAVRHMKTTTSDDLLVGGADLASQAFNAGLVDEVQLFVAPVYLGGGKPALTTDARAHLELLDERRFDNGGVYLRYRVLS